MLINSDCLPSATTNGASGRDRFLYSMVPVPPLPLILSLRPAMANYAATVGWESYAAGDYQLSAIKKEMTLRVQSSDTGLAVTFETNPPTLVEPADPAPLATLALRLATLYARVVVQVAPTGNLAALLNHAELLRTGDQLFQEMRAATLEDDQITPTLLSFAERQLQSPTSILSSLQNDYLYQTLLPDFYLQPLGSTDAVPRQRRFVNFFDNVTLCFLEKLNVLPAATPNYLIVRLQGALDAQQTNLPAVHESINKALRLALPPAEAPALETLPDPHFNYEATYTLELATGLPSSCELTVYARVGQLYNKQYTLTINRL